LQVIPLKIKLLDFVAERSASTMFGPASWSKTLSNLHSMFLVFILILPPRKTLGTLQDAYPRTAWLGSEAIGNGSQERPRLS
jgi:hypothetical protein